METRERVEIAGVQLGWQVKGVDEALTMRSAEVLLLRSFLRETVSEDRRKFARCCPWFNHRVPW